MKMTVINIEQLSAYYDGELGAGERRSIDVHVSGCRDCQSAIRRWQRASVALAAKLPSRARIRVPAVLLASIAALLLVGSGAAMATGLFNEVFRFGELSAVASRPVTLDGARVAGLPLPRSDGLPGGWRVDQVQLVMTPSWRSVDVQYRRPGARGMGVTTWSQDINVSPTAERREFLTLSGLPVEVGYSGDGASARFAHQGSTVIIRVFTNEVDTDGLRALIQAWIEQAR
jgi:hypothetical protein